MATSTSSGDARDRHDHALEEDDADETTRVETSNSTIAPPPPPQRRPSPKPKHILVGSPTGVASSPSSARLSTSGAPSHGPPSNSSDGGRRGFFSKFFSRGEPAIKRSHSSSSMHPSEQVGLLAHTHSSHATALPPTPSSAAAAAAAAAASTGVAAVPPARRKWLRYPVRVPILSLLLVSLLARTSEGWTSIGGFLCGFLLFEGFSAPDTGQPNRIDAWIRKGMVAFQKCRRARRQATGGRAKPTRAEKRQERQELSRMRSIVHYILRPCTWCCRRKKPHHDRRHSQANESAQAGSGGGGGDGETATLLAAAAADEEEEEDTDVLLDVAVSVTEDAAPPPATPSTADPAHPPRPGTPAIAAAPDVVPQTPLHPLTNLVAESLTDELTEQLKESIEKIEKALPPLPTVTALDATDTAADLPAAPTHAATVGTVGGKASWMQMSISLRFTLYNFHIHLHHWVYLLIVCLFLFLEQTYWAEHAASYPIYAFASAFCLGGSVQGLKYADWSHVIWRKQREQQSHQHQHQQHAHPTHAGEGEQPPPRTRRNSRSGPGATPRTSHHGRRVSGLPSAAPILSPTSAQADRMETGQTEAFSLLRHLEGGLSAPTTDDESEMPPRPIALTRANSAINMADYEAAAQIVAQHV